MEENSVVREVLGDKNYKVWSDCMEIYLLSQDLWDIIDLDDDESKSWMTKNALALHAIHKSCDTTTLSQISALRSAKKAWYLLKLMNRPSHRDSDARLYDGDDNDDKVTEKELRDTVDYTPFVEATKEENWADMEKFLHSHPEANVSAVVVDGRTALHYLLGLGNIEIGRLLLEKTNATNLTIQDDKHYTAFASLTSYNQPGVINLLEDMVSKNKELPNIGQDYTVPIVMASWKGFKDTTRYLYDVTDKNIFNPEKGKVGADLLVNCIDIKLFGIASDIVRKFPMLLQQQSRENISPIHALAKYFSRLKNERRHKKSSDDDEQSVYNQAREFLRFVCEQVSSFDINLLADHVWEAMVEATKNGVAEFVREILIANPILIKCYIDGSSLFGHAITNRQEKIYSLIYNFIEEKDFLLSNMNPENNNILHLVAKLPPSAVLDRSSGEALQMQRELQWFEEIWSMAKPRYREDLNINGLTPHALFTEAHAKLMEDGEKAMKDTAQASTVVGALIVTMMFAVAFAVPGGNNDTGLPIFLRKTLFRVFIVSDALSLYSSTTSVLVFLGILTSRYAEQDFLLKLPRKMIIGLASLFFSITTMMISFCTALVLMLDGELQYILPTVMLACVPIVIFLSSIVPVLSEMVTSTFGPSIFDKSLELREKIEAKRAKDKKPSVEDTNMLDRTEQECIVNVHKC